jgi:hypothetical protein
MTRRINFGMTMKGRSAPRNKSRQFSALGWLGRQDSNLGMAESKSAALPLGYAPSTALRARPIPSESIGTCAKSSARDDSGGAQPDQRPRLPGLIADAITRAAIGV